jgi:UDP-N-acetylglucosamine 2-epimerase (non-hydrolysing)
MKILTVFGTRPEAIKMAPLVHAINKSPQHQQIVCVTAQHRQMLDQVLNVFDIEPDVDLNLMSAKQDLCDVTALVITSMREVLLKHKPDAVLVHGDTTTAMATALAAFYLGIPVGHIEAGLRTYDMHAPFPEEFNRQTIGKIANWHFAPTKLSAENLIRDGVDKSRISVTGNTVIDAMRWMLSKIDINKSEQINLHNHINNVLGFDFINSRYILITGHRRENFGNGFLNICEAIRLLAIKFQAVQFVYPVHLNPKVQAPVYEILGNLENVRLIPPQDYQTFILMLRHCYLVLTDSGGIQEEAPSLGKPVLVMREVTERPEAVQAGTVRLVGANTNKIVSEATKLLTDELEYQNMSFSHNPYGDGSACEKILEKLVESL